MTLYRTVVRFLPLAAALSLMAACGGSTDAPTVSLRILPTAQAACPGATIPMLLTVGGQAGDPTSVDWTSSDSLLPVTSAGVIEVRGYGASIIAAADRTNPSQSTTATVNFVDPVVQRPTVHKIVREGSTTTVPADSLSGTVSISIDAPTGLTCNNAYISQANLIVVHGSGSGVLVDHVDGAPIAAGQSLAFTFHTDSTSGGTPVFPNGDYEVYVNFGVHPSFHDYGYAISSQPLAVSVTN